MKKSLIWALALLLALPALAMGEEAPAPLVKDETVYAMLDASGAAQNVLVVSRIETPEEGRYVDYGAYEQIAAMVSGVTPVVEGETIAWELPADEAGFYSVGTPSEAELPVTLEVVYALDGETVAPDALAGQSGRVSITMTVRPNENALQVYRDHYMAQIQLPLSMDTCANIDAPGASGALVGQTNTLSYTVLPGQEATFTVAFDAQNFSLSGITMACARVDLGGMMGLDVDELLEQADALTEGARALADGTDELVGGMGELADGLNTLAVNTRSLADGLAALETGLSEAMAAVTTLADGMTQLNDAMPQLTEGATAYIDGAQSALSGVDALADGLGALAAQGESLTEGVDQLTQGLSAMLAQMPAEQQAALSQQLTALSEGLTAYVEGVSQVSEQTAQLAEGASALTANGETLKAGLTEQQSGFSALNDGVTQLAEQTQSIPAALSELTGGADQLAGGLEEAAASTAETPEQAQALVDGQTELADGLEEAVSALTDIPALTESDVEIPSFVSEEHSVRSLQFVYTTAAISVPKPEEEPAPEEEELTFWDRLVDLF